MALKIAHLTDPVVLVAAVSCGGADARGPTVSDQPGLAKLDFIAICYSDDARGKVVSLEYVTRVNIRDRCARSEEVDPRQPTAPISPADPAWPRPSDADANTDANPDTADAA